MELSKRLEAVMALVTPGLVLADIGTDHGFIPVELVRRGAVPSAIAMDVREGPLSRARVHIAQAHLEDRIEARLSDGLDGLRPGEAQCAVIAGMGGPLMRRILEASPETVRFLRELVLQPQSDVPAFRAYLAQSGFTLLAEDMVLEDGKYYPMMKVAPPGAGSDGAAACTRWLWPDRELALSYGPFLLSGAHPVLKQYLIRERRILMDILSKLEAAGTVSDQKNRHRTEQIEASLKLNRRAMEYDRADEHMSFQ